ncbi:hypothetical protein HK098_000789 [Nowakowskiella sp. JEL0407]|nr:hypothetical protein HK098_000789 [Nowakowskiella sp. JEL0407]
MIGVNTSGINSHNTSIISELSSNNSYANIGSPISPTLQGGDRSFSHSRKSSQSFQYIPGLAPTPGPNAYRSDVIANMILPSTPIPSMHWSKLKFRGKAPPRALRAHTITPVEDQLFVFGGCDSGVCFNDLYIFDVETLCWSQPEVFGDIPNPCRAHSAVHLNGKIYVFGGGDGPSYFSSLHSLDTETMKWTELTASTPINPGPRRAHTSFAYEGSVYVYAGGDGVCALNDLFQLRVEGDEVTWYKVETSGVPPKPRGYHTSNLVADCLVVYGGSDGHECFADIHTLDMLTMHWMTIEPSVPIPRLSHTATQIGSYLFIFGGHDGTSYSNGIHLLNLVTMTWEQRKIYGTAPSGRGYHAAVLSDSRLYVYGGYDGQNVFNELWALDLSGSAYLPQITSFKVAASLE